MRGMTISIEHEKYTAESAESESRLSLLRSQWILFNSRRKFGMLYFLATLAGLLCLSGVTGIMGSEDEFLTLIRGTLTLPIISLMVAIGMYILNDLVDADLDKANAKKRPIPSGLVSKRQAWIFILMTNSVGVALAMTTLNLATVLIIVPMLLIGVMYSAPRIALMNRFVIKNVAISAFYTLCLLLGMTSAYGVGLAANNPAVPLHAMGMFGIMIFVGSIVNDMGDVKGDKAAGRRTIPIVLGGKNTLKMLIVLLAGMPAISWVLYGTTGSITLATTAAISILAFFAMLRMAKMRKGLDDIESVRRHHKKWFPLHIVLQAGIVAGGLLL